jgi:hypothetical protein
MNPATIPSVPLTLGAAPRVLDIAQVAREAAAKIGWGQRLRVWLALRCVGGLGLGVYTTSHVTEAAQQLQALRALVAASGYLPQRPKCKRKLGILAAHGLTALLFAELRLAPRAPAAKGRPATTTPQAGR